MLLSLIRKIIPIKVRQGIGLWILSKLSRSKFLAYPFFFLLCGRMPKNLRLLPNAQCSVEYNGRKIVAPRDGILAFIEILQDEVYEKFGSPKRGDVVLDLGAYVGMFTLKAARQVGDIGKVIAIEPNPSNISYLRSNVETSKNISVVEEAILNKVGEGKLYISGVSSQCHSLIYPHNKFLKVRINTLDNLVEELRLPQVDFIKIDIEGAELQALEGARGVLKNNVKLAIASYHPLPNGQPELPLIVAFLESVGYQTRVLDKYVYAEKTRRGNPE